MKRALPSIHPVPRTVDIKVGLFFLSAVRWLTAPFGDSSRGLQLDGVPS